ncbi:MAG: putative bifunctional diguanylate cyclase/phosphodiesterase, partial [Gaiellales bacterium]
MLRFALYTGVGLAIAAAGILLLVRHLSIDQAERSAAQHARFVQEAFLTAELHPGDFRVADDPRRVEELDAMFRDVVLWDGTVLVDLVGPRGSVAYSTDHRRIGAPTDFGLEVADASGGSILSKVTRVPDPTLEPGARVDEELKVLATFGPFVASDGQVGVVAIYQDYAPIAEAAQSAFLPVAGIFEVVVVLLAAALIPALRRVTKRIGAQIREIEYRAYYDELTGLPNRELFRDRIEQAIPAGRRENHRVGVMLMDIDDFKEINDTLGHHVGDLLLREFGQRVRSCLRATDTLTRLGGDEFGVLLPRTDPEHVTELTDRIGRSLQQPFILEGLPVSAHASIGITFAPDHGQDHDTLLRRADMAMYVAKETRSGHALYDPEKDTGDARKLALVGELRNALDRGEIVLFYQPQIDIHTGVVHGVETLVRWNHPRYGLLGASDFIPLAERTGLVRPLGRYVLESALEQRRAWQREGLDVTVAVNLTMPDLLDLSLPRDIQRVLDRLDVTPASLELEITESAIMGDPFRVRQVLDRISEMGVRLAIDDFGTGYSSLAYLKRLPVETIKIDRSFVMNMTNDANDVTIVRSMVELGR